MFSGQLFQCKFYEVLQNTPFTENLRVSASGWAPKVLRETLFLCLISYFKNLFFAIYAINTEAVVQRCSVEKGVLKKYAKLT